MIDDSRPKAGSTFDLAILQACAPLTFSKIRALPPQRHKDSLDSPHFSGFCLDWLRIVNTSHAKGVITPRFRSSCEWVQKRIGHFGFPLNLDTRRGVIVVREPKSRIISSFLDWPVHHEGMLAKTWEALSRAIAKASVPGLAHAKHPRSGKRKLWGNSVETAAVYTSHPAMRGCVTKTLLGYACYSTHALTDAQVAQAVKRLRSFRFVGIMEDWNEMIIDYMHFSSHGISPDSAVMTKHRATGDHQLAATISKGLSSYRDPFDDRIYAEAKKIAAAQRNLRLAGAKQGRDAWSCGS